MPAAAAQEPLSPGAGRFVDVGATRVFLHDVGSGAPVVLLHGGGPGASGWSNYHRNIAALAATHRVICPDIPGFGQSGPRPAGSAEPGWWADVMVGLLDALDIPKAHFVGNSLGGMVTLKIALEAPGRIDRMVLMGTGGSTPLFSPFPTEGIRILRTFYDGPGPSRERLQGFLKQFVYNPKLLTDAMVDERLAAAMDPRIVANPPMRWRKGDAAPEELWRDARLTALPHDTLLVWGRDDRVMPLDLAFPLLKQIPRARLYVIPQCGHWAQWEHAAEFNALTLEFLAGFAR